MANYGVKYKCEWVSPMRENREYEIRILERDYSGVVRPLRPTGDVLTITQGAIGDNELVAIKSSEAELSLLCLEGEETYSELFTTDPLRYKLQVFRKVPTKTGYMRALNEWEGYLSVGTYVQDYKKPPYHISLRAVDGLAILRNIPYLYDGEPYTGTRLLEDMIRGIMRSISDMGVYYQRFDNIVSPFQSAPSVRSIKIDSSALYASFGDTTPSCYEVLEALLNTLQLQIFQGYGVWHVRSIASMAGVERMNVEAYSNGNGNPIPLYGTEGEGVSVAASMSLLAPYYKMNVDRPELIQEVRGGAYPLGTESFMWKDSGSKIKLSKWQWKDRLRLKAEKLKKAHKTGYIGAVFTPDIEVRRSADTMNVSFDAYNLSYEEKTIRVGLFAYPSEYDIRSIWLNLLDNSGYQNTVSIAGWDTSKNAWGFFLTGGTWVTGDPYVSYMQTVTLSPAKGGIIFEQPTPESQMGKSEVTLTAQMSRSGLFRGSTSFAIFVVGEYQQALPPIEVRNVSISFANENGVAEDVTFEEGVVCDKGLEDIDYRQHFADGWVTASPGYTFQASLLSSDGDILRGLVLAQQRPLIADAVLYNMRMLRGGVRRQLNGEVFTKERISPISRWVSLDGHRFYTNYIKRLYSRGVYEVELRELPRNDAESYWVSGSLVENIVGLDTSYYIADGKKVVRVDCETHAQAVVHQADGELPYPWLNEGQRCVSIVQRVKAEDDDVFVYDYECSAYDTNGKRLSTIDGIIDLIRDSMPITSVSSFARSARYDANTHTWVLMSSTDIAVYAMVLARDGSVIGFSTFSYAGQVTVTSTAVIPNGFMFATSTTQWWHSNSLHSGADATVLSAREIKGVIAGNERFFVAEDADSFKIYRRTNIEHGVEAEPLYTAHKPCTFVAMNNALVVFRSGVNCIVFDARSGKIETYQNEEADRWWLCGDKVYSARLSSTSLYVTSIDVRVGVGEAEEYPYITSDGEDYITSEGLTYNVLK